MTRSGPPDPDSAPIRRACRALTSTALSRTSRLELADRFLDGLADLLDTERVALLLLDEATFGFEMIRARPGERAPEMEATVSALIESGAFAEALRESRPIDADGQPGERILLIPMVCAAVSAGMGLAVLADGRDGADPPPSRLEDLEVLTTLFGSRLEGHEAWDRAAREIGVQRHIQEQKEDLNLDLERSIFRLRRLEQQRDDLTRMIVHDLRTPMTSVKTTLEMMARGLIGKLTPKEAEMARVAARSTDHLIGMISDLLDISKFEAGEMTASPRETSLGPVLEGVVESLDALARMEHKAMAFEGPPDAVEVTTDPDLLRRIVENLTGNALRFSPPHSTVRIALHRDGDAVEVAVRDEGEGIPPEYLDRIFEKFVQVEGRQRGRRLGTGLGLTFCQYAAQALGGTIRVESEPGCGSTFTVRLPIR